MNLKLGGVRKMMSADLKRVRKNGILYKALLGLMLSMTATTITFAAPL